MPWEMANFWETPLPGDGGKQTAYCRSKTTTAFSLFAVFVVVVVGIVIPFFFLLFSKK